MGDLVAQSSGKVGLVVGVELRVVAATRYRDVCQAPIDEFFSRPLAVYVDEHTVGGLPLAAVARYGMAVVKMRILLGVERNGTA